MFLDLSVWLLLASRCDLSLLHIFIAERFIDAFKELLILWCFRLRFEPVFNLVQFFNAELYKFLVGHE